MGNRGVDETPTMSEPAPWARIAEETTANVSAEATKTLKNERTTFFNLYFTSAWSKTYSAKSLTPALSTIKEKTKNMKLTVTKKQAKAGA